MRPEELGFGFVFCVWFVFYSSCMAVPFIIKSEKYLISFFYANKCEGVVCRKIRPLRNKLQNVP